MDDRTCQTKSEPLTFTSEPIRQFDKGWAEKQDDRIAQYLTSSSRLSRNGLLIVSNQSMSEPHSFVYAARDIERGEVKIGRTRTPFYRVRSLSARSLYVMELILRVSARHSVASERHVQWMLRDSNIRSEWFTASPADVESAFLSVAQLDEPEKKDQVGRDKRFLTADEMHEMRAEGVRWADILRVAYCTSIQYVTPASHERKLDRLRTDAGLAVKRMMDSGKSGVQLAKMCNVSADTIRKTQREGARMHEYNLHRIVNGCAV